MHPNSESSPLQHQPMAVPFQSPKPTTAEFFRDQQQQFPLNTFFQHSLSWEDLLAMQSNHAAEQQPAEREWQASWGQVYKDYLMWRRDQFDDQQYANFILAAGRQWGDQPELLADIFFDSYFQLFIVKNFHLTEIDPEEPMDIDHDQFFTSEDGYYLFEYQHSDADDDVVKIIKLILRSANARDGVETVQTAIAQMQYSSYEMLQEEFYGQAAERLRSMGGMVYEDSLPWISKVQLSETQMESLLSGGRTDSGMQTLPTTSAVLQPKVWIHQWLNQSNHRWSFDQYYVRSLQALMVQVQQKNDLKEWQEKVEFQLTRFMTLGEQLWAHADQLGMVLEPVSVKSAPENIDPVQFAYRLGRSVHDRQMKMLQTAVGKLEHLFSPYAKTVDRNEPPMHLSMGEVMTQLFNEIRGLSSSAFSGQFDICSVNGQRFIFDLSKELTQLAGLIESMDRNFFVSWQEHFENSCNQQSLLFNLETILLSDFMLSRLPEHDLSPQTQAHVGLNFQQLILVSEQYFSQSVAEQGRHLKNYWQRLLSVSGPCSGLCWWLSELLNVHLQGLNLRELTLDDRKYISGIIIHD